MPGWTLIAINPPPNALILHKLRMRPGRKRPNMYFRHYRDGDETRMLADIENLKAAGIRGTARRVKADSKKSPRPPRAPLAPVLLPNGKKRTKSYNAPFARSYDQLADFAKKRRRDQTPAESALWGHLHGGRLGVRVRREMVLAGYIADFFIPQWRLVVEIDGSAHDDRAAYDARRDAHLRAEGFHVIRFSNGRAINETRAVLDEIIAFGRGLPPLPRNALEPARKYTARVHEDTAALGDLFSDRDGQPARPLAAEALSRPSVALQKPAAGGTCSKRAAHSERPKGEERRGSAAS